MILPPRISLARLPTPLQRLDRLSAETGGPTIWLKRDDLTDTQASGNKLRKLEFSVGQALAEGADTLVTSGGAQSNHCRATAVVAATHGLGCTLLLRGREPDVADGNLLLDQLFGASIQWLSAVAFDDLPTVFAATADALRAAGRQPFVIPVGASDEVGLWGYAEAAGELASDFASAGIARAAVVSATGSGGTLAGLMVGRELYGLAADIWGINVCDDRTFFMNKTAHDIAAWQARYGQLLPREPAFNLIDGYVGPGYAKADPQVFDTIARIARLEGVVFDPVYTGKAFDALLTEIRRGRFDDHDDVVFIHTGGLYGVFPQREAMLEAVARRL